MVFTFNYNAAMQAKAERNKMVMCKYKVQTIKSIGIVRGNVQNRKVIF